MRFKEKYRNKIIESNQRIWSYYITDLGFHVLEGYYWTTDDVLANCIASDIGEVLPNTLYIYNPAKGTCHTCNIQYMDEVFRGQLRTLKRDDEMARNLLVKYYSDQISDKLQEIDNFKSVIRMLNHNSKVIVDD